MYFPCWSKGRSKVNLKSFNGFNSTLCKIQIYLLLLVLFGNHFLTLSIYPTFSVILLLANSGCQPNKNNLKVELLV